MRITAKWAEVAKKLNAGQRNSITCPVCGNETLDATWVPIEDGTGDGEFIAKCRTCNAQAAFLVRGMKDLA